MKKFIKVIILLMIIFSTTTYYRVISFDYQVSKVVRLNDATDETINKIFEMSTYYIPLEKVLVKYYQSKNINQHDCNLLSGYTDKLLLINPRSSQAFFIKSVCSEKIGDLNSALDSAYSALKFDNFNTTYLLTIAILQFNLGDITQAQDYVNLIEKIDPNTNNLNIIKEAIANSN
jgi:tetratricopeptide (TPR) repeat protein